MLENIKNIIKNSAKEAVIKAEELFGSNMGSQKKALAIEYVINLLPVPIFIKPIIKIILNKFIDNTIELAVQKMKSI